MTTVTLRKSLSAETHYGGFIDAIGGIATVVLAVIALAGIRQTMMASIATIIFAAALLMQGGTMLSEFARLIFPSESAASDSEQFGGGTLATLFLAGAAGIVLGILALIGIQPIELTAIAIIAFGAALVLSSNAVWQLHVVRRSAMGGVQSGSEILASEMASGSAGIQALAGLAAIVLGILAVVGTNPIVLTPVALIVMGATIVMTGSTLSGAVAGFMSSTTTTTSPKPSAA